VSHLVAPQLVRALVMQGRRSAQHLQALVQMDWGHWGERQQARLQEKSSDRKDARTHTK
jgi:hypothetical protein